MTLKTQAIALGNNVDALVELFNSRLTLDEKAIQKVVETGRVLKYDDEKDLYSVSNHKYHVGLMWHLKKYHDLSHGSMVKVMDQTKGYGMVEVGEAIELVKEGKSINTNDKTVLELNARIAELEAHVEYRDARAVKGNALLIDYRAQLNAKDVRINSLCQEVTKKDKTIINLEEKVSKVNTQLEVVTNSLRQLKLNNITTKVAKILTTKVM